MNYLNEAKVRELREELICNEEVGRLVLRAMNTYGYMVGDKAVHFMFESRDEMIAALDEAQSPTTGELREQTVACMSLVANSRGEEVPIIRAVTGLISMPIPEKLKKDRSALNDKSYILYGSTTGYKLSYNYRVGLHLLFNEIVTTLITYVEAHNKTLTDKDLVIWVNAESSIKMTTGRYDSSKVALEIRVQGITDWIKKTGDHAFQPIGLSEREYLIMKTFKELVLKAVTKSVTKVLAK